MTALLFNTETGIKMLTPEPAFRYPGLETFRRWKLGVGRYLEKGRGRIWTNVMQRYYWGGWEQHLVWRWRGWDGGKEKKLCDYYLVKRYRQKAKLTSYSDCGLRRRDDLHVLFGKKVYIRLSDGEAVSERGWYASTEAWSPARILPECLAASH